MDKSELLYKYKILCDGQPVKESIEVVELLKPLEKREILAEFAASQRMGVGGLKLLIVDNQKTTTWSSCQFKDETYVA